MRGRLLMLVLPTLSACGPGAVPDTALDEARTTAAITRGDAIVQATFMALSDRLGKAMAEGGPSHAVDYCMVAALPITDSVAIAHDVSIKRTSDKLRAPHDAPDEHERARLHEQLRRLASGTRAIDLPTEVHILGDSIAYYKPILVASPLCLTCHGSPGVDLDPDAYAVIRERYPDDAAIGYALGDFRGLWSVRWPR